MALTTCPDCSTQVSDQAAACPKCGRPIASPHAYGAPVAPKKGMSVLAIVLLVLGLGAVAVVGLLVVLSVFGTRKYIANAKRAEAMNSLGIMAKDAVAAYEEA